jgi:pimeloyl-ACP methyl ester carboxylesterase
VVLLHGFPQTSLSWEVELAALASNGYRAIAFDQRGYSAGVRPAAVSDYQVSELVSDVLAVADALGFGVFDLVGHDWGSIVAWATAYAHPERLRTLTTVSVPHPTPMFTARREDEDQAQRSAYITMFQQKGHAETRILADDAATLRKMYQHAVPEDNVDEYVKHFQSEGALTAALNWYRALDLIPEVGKIEVPTLFVWSTEDIAVGSTAALATKDWVSGPYRFEILEDVTHWIPEEASVQLSVFLLEHLHAH